MKLDFSKYPVRDRGYAERPMVFLDIVPGKILGGIVELALIETGSRVARERWQKTQLRNLLAHASQRSSFWRNRLGTKQSKTKLAELPILTRADVRQQVEQEGSLLQPADGLEIFKHGTAGSSGTPLVFYASKMNVQYNKVRYLAHEFMDGKDLSVNRTQLRTATENTAKKIIQPALPLKKGRHGLETSVRFSRRVTSNSLKSSSPIRVIWCANALTRSL